MHNPVLNRCNWRLFSGGGREVETLQEEEEERERVEKKKVYQPWCSGKQGPWWLSGPHWRWHSGRSWEKPSWLLSSVRQSHTSSALCRTFSPRTAHCWSTGQNTGKVKKETWTFQITVFSSEWANQCMQSLYPFLVNLSSSIRSSTVQ